MCRASKARVHEYEADGVSVVPKEEENASTEEAQMDVDLSLIHI